MSSSKTDIGRKEFKLGREYYEQQKYAEAEQLFRQSAQKREKALGAEDTNTLKSKYRLVIALYRQGNFVEAESLGRESVKQREKALGVEHWRTLSSKYILALTLYEQRKYAEAEQLLRKSVEQRKKVLGADHEDTLESKRLLQKVVVAKAPAAPTNTLADNVSSRLGDFFADGNQRRTVYTDSEIQQVSLLLGQLNLQWSKVPRTYMVLRTISCLDVLDTFIDLGFSDYWFPVTERSFPQTFCSSRRSEFLDAQKLVMTKSLDLEKGENGQHCFFREHEHPPLEKKGILGSGGFGRVYRVLSLISFREYALKQVPRSIAFGGRKANSVKNFIAEIMVLKRIKHHHVVEFVGSYTDPKHMCLIMSPVADMDLSAYLARADTARHRELRTFFGCLARALEFLHAQSIRHKDIKPSNILVHRGNVLYTDFGTALDFTDADGSTTVGMANEMTWKYCAPEVADHEPRNRSSDIWSLGIVFLEMTAVLKGRKFEYIYDFLKEHGTRRQFVRTNPAGTSALITELEQTGSSTDNAALEWVRDMIMSKQHLRPTAASLLGSIISAGQKGAGNGAFCGTCCASHDDSLSDPDEHPLADNE